MPEPMQLDESLYSITPEELTFYLAWTGISDEAELKQHIIDIQARAYAIFPYPCIRRFSFIRLKIQRHPAYKHVLEYGQKHPDAIYLELGCCFANDSRKLMFDGYPPQNMIATDMHEGLWKLGFELFKDDSSKFPISFVPGDILSPEVLDSSAKKPDTRPDLPKVTSLTELLGYVSFIRASAFFHLFSEEIQAKIARGCISLLIDSPGATIFGSHIGASNAGVYMNSRGTERSMFCHSPQSWEEMWQNAAKDKEENIRVKVWVKLIDIPGDDPLFTGGKGWMVWAVTSLGIKHPESPQEAGPAAQIDRVWDESLRQLTS